MDPDEFVRPYTLHVSRGGLTRSVGQQVMCLQYLGLHLNEEDYEKEYNKADAVGVVLCCAWVAR